MSYRIHLFYLLAFTDCWRPSNNQPTWFRVFQPFKRRKNYTFMIESARPHNHPSANDRRSKKKYKKKKSTTKIGTNFSQSSWLPISLSFSIVYNFIHGKQKTYINNTYIFVYIYRERRWFCWSRSWKRVWCVFEIEVFSFCKLWERKIGCACVIEVRKGLFLNGF